MTDPKLPTWLRYTPTTEESIDCDGRDAFEMWVEGKLVFDRDGLVGRFEPGGAGRPQ